MEHVATVKRLVAGIFVGGASSRMGQPKGLLPAPSGGSLVERTLAMCRDLGADVVLLGARPEYESLGVTVLADRFVGIGPLAGVESLLRLAATDGAVALTCPCDMPYLPAALLVRLLRSVPEAQAVAARRADGRVEPLLARYDAARCLAPITARAEGAARGESGAVWRALVDLGAAYLDVPEGEEDALSDWDTPEDVLSRSRP